MCSICNCHLTDFAKNKSVFFLNQYLYIFSLICCILKYDFKMSDNKPFFRENFTKSFNFEMLQLIFLQCISWYQAIACRRLCGITETPTCVKSAPGGKNARWPSHVASLSLSLEAQLATSGHSWCTHQVSAIVHKLT